MLRVPREDPLFHVAFRCDHDLDEDEALGMYMAALDSLFLNMEDDLRYGQLLSFEEE